MKCWPFIRQIVESDIANEIASGLIDYYTLSQDFNITVYGLGLLWFGSSSTNEWLNIYKPYAGTATFRVCRSPLYES